MRRSIKLLSQQLIKARDQFYESKKVVRKDFLKTVAVGGCIQILFCLFFEEFGIPTPELCYDFRLSTSPEFNDFVRNGKYAEFDMTLNSTVRTYKIEQGEFLKKIGKSDFRGTIIKSDM